MHRWVKILVFAVVLFVLAATARWWVAPLLTFLGVNSELIQSIDSAIQIVLVLSGSIMSFFGWKSRSRQTIVIVNPADKIWSRFAQRLPEKEILSATKSYLKYLVERYQYLEFKGMGISDRVPLRLKLLDVYVPLRARVELPKGETWARERRVAGRRPTEEEVKSMGERLSEPMLVLDLVKQNDGLIILGDPGRVRPRS